MAASPGRPGTDDPDDGNDRVDVKSIGSISSLRSRFEASSSAAPGYTRPIKVVQTNQQDSTGGSPNPRTLVGKAVTPKPSPSISRPRTPEPRMASTLNPPRITEQPPSPEANVTRRESTEDSSTFAATASTTAAGASSDGGLPASTTTSAQTIVKKKPAPPVPRPLGSATQAPNHSTIINSTAANGVPVDGSAPASSPDPGLAGASSATPTSIPTPSSVPRSSMGSTVSITKTTVASAIGAVPSSTTRDRRRSTDTELERESDRPSSPSKSAYQAGRNDTASTYIDAPNAVKAGIESDLPEEDQHAERTGTAVSHAGPSNSTVAAGTGPEEEAGVEVAKNVSSLRNMFDRPPPTPLSATPASMSTSNSRSNSTTVTPRPSLAPTRANSSIFINADTRPVEPVLMPSRASEGRFGDREVRIGEDSGSSLEPPRTGMRAKIPPPPPPPLHSRPKVTMPISATTPAQVLDEHTTTGASVRQDGLVSGLIPGSEPIEKMNMGMDIGTGKTGRSGGLSVPPPPPPMRRKAPGADRMGDDDDDREANEAMGVVYSRSPEPLALHLETRGNGRNSLPPAGPTKAASTSTSTSSTGTSRDESGPSGSLSVPPVLPPRQTSGGSTSSATPIPIPVTSPAPALPPRTPGVPPALPDRNNTLEQSYKSGLSRSASLAVGRSYTPGRSGEGQAGYVSRSDALKDMVKRSSTVLRHGHGHGHRLDRHAGRAPTPEVDREQDSGVNDDAWVPPPPPVRGASSSSAASSNVVVPKPSRSLDRYDSEEDVMDEEDEEGVVEPDPAASAALQGGGRGIANLKSSANRALAEYPDSTRVNRRAPEFVPRQRVSLGGHHHVHCFAVSGHKLCTGGSTIKVFDLTLGDGKPVLVVEPRHFGMESKGKDVKMTAMSFRSPASSDEEGRYLWCGTNVGHICELDTLTGEITDVKSGLHAASVTHVFRHDEWMVTLDELGKAHVFGPFAGGEEVSRRQTNAPCRTLRTADRQNFATMLGGQLWTASGPAARSTTNSALRGPTLRVYDPSGVTSGNTAGKTTFTSEWTGAVTAATFDPFDKRSVYLAHEGGYVSIFDRDSLVCRQVLKISPTDILGLEYVGDYLWAGTRGGTINVYDTRTSPWTTINTWVAHPELPIQRIYADPYSIDQSGKYAVWTWARDGLHAWDGLLSVDWIETAMQEREAEYCRFRDLTVLISSWNIDSSKPGDLSGSPENQSFLQQCLTSVETPDVIVFGWQEVIDLNNRKLTAKTMLFGSKSKQDGRGNTDGVSRAYRDWQDKLQMAVRMNTPPDCLYTMLDAESMVGLMTVVFVKSSLRDSLRDVAITTIKRGIGGVYGNKGAVVARMTIDDSSVCFINVHLAAGQSHKAARNADVAGILEEKAVFSTSDTGKGYVNGGDGSAILDHETVFLNGDLNYRIDQRRDNVISSVNAGDLEFLLEHDQLRKEIKGNTSFRLRSFHEAPIAFAPTYKYTPNSIEYDQSEKKRIPAWCDRILWKSRQDERVECLHYRRYEPTVSDHRPISAAFKLTAKSIDPSDYAAIRAEVEREWFQREGDLMQRIVDAFEDYK